MITYLIDFLLDKFLPFLLLVVTCRRLSRDKDQHRQQLLNSREIHDEAIRNSKDLYRENLRTTKDTYLIKLFHSLEQHFQLVNTDLISSSREHERDMFDQVFCCSRP